MPAFRSGLFCLLGRSSGDLDEVVLVVPHARLLHVSKLPQAMARFNALNEVVTLILGARLNEIHRRLIDCENIGRGGNADIGNRGFRGAPARAVAINHHAAHHVDEDDLLPEMVADGLRGLLHVFH